MKLELKPQGQLGIPETTIYTWRTWTKQYGSIAFVGNGNKRIDPKTAEVIVLEKKTKELEAANDILKSALGFFRREPKEVDAREMFQWIWTKDKAKYSIKTICKVVHVSETGYYKWLRSQSNPYKYEDLLAKILQIRAENPDYGAYRMYLYLQLYDNYTGSYYLILKLYKTHYLILKKKTILKG